MFLSGKDWNIAATVVKYVVSYVFNMTTGERKKLRKHGFEIRKLSTEKARKQDLDHPEEKTIEF